MEGSLFLFTVFIATWLVVTWIIGLVFMLAEIRDIPRNEWWVGALGWFFTSFAFAPLLLLSAITQARSQRLRWRTPDRPPRTASAIPASPPDDPPAEDDPEQRARLEEAIRETLDRSSELLGFSRRLSGTTVGAFSVEDILQAAAALPRDTPPTSPTGRQAPSDPPRQSLSGRRVRLNVSGDFVPESLVHVDYAAMERHIRDDVATNAQAARDQIEEQERQLEETLMSQLDSGDSRVFAYATHALGQLAARRRARREAAIRAREEREELRPATTSVPQLQSLVVELRLRFRAQQRVHDRLRARIRDLEEMVQEQQAAKPGAASRQHRRIRIRQPEEES